MAAPTNPFLPQYQDEVSQAQQIQMLAQLLASNKANTQGQMISGHYVRSHPLAHINNLVANVGGAYFQNKAQKQLADVLKRQAMQQQAEREGVLGMTVPQDMRDPAAPQVDDTGASSGASVPAMKPADLRGAEQKALKSPFPDVQAIGKALMEQRVKSMQAREAELLKRVDLPSIQAGNLDTGAPKAEFGVTDGVAYRKSEAGITPSGQYTHGSMPGADGRSMAVQQAPFTGKIDAIDKAPRTNVRVNAGTTPEDPYWKQLATDIGKQDAERIKQARDAREALPAVERMRKVHFDAKGQWTGGPLAGPIRLIRDTMSQLGLPLDPALDLNNAKIQAEMTGQIAKAILSQGRGLTDEDRKALEKAWPTDRLTPAQFPAFLNQYEATLRGNAKISDETRKRIEQGSGGRFPTVLRETPLPSTTKPLSEMTSEELAERKRQLLGQ